jgi:uncharacterized UPF0160 family protein
MNVIVTHNGIFHADEVLATALLEVFNDREYNILRTRDDKELSNAIKNSQAYVIDVGGCYDGLTLFDHHHDSNLLSSAGLIWQHIKDNGLTNDFDYKKIDSLVSEVDDHDRGIKFQSMFEFSNLIQTYNAGNIYGEEQNEAFISAVYFAKTVIASYKRDTELIEKATEITENAKDLGNGVFLLSEFIHLWGSFINGTKRPEVNRVIWEDKHTGEWKVQVPNIKRGDFTLNGEALLQNENMKFVHANGFFAVAVDKNTLYSYLGIKES